MSNEPKASRNIGTGERARLEARTGVDGSVEYVIEDGPKATSQGPGGAASEPEAAPQEGSGGSSLALVALAGVALAVVLGIGAIVAWNASGSSSLEGGAGEDEPVGFKPYGGGPNEDPGSPAMGAALNKKAPAPKDDDEELPEELEGWDVDESDEEVIVLEESHPDEAPEEEGWELEEPERELDPEEFYRRGNPNPEQRKILRALNENLDEGKVPRLKRPPEPKKIDLDDPRFNSRIRVPDNLSGPPSRFPGGKPRIRVQE